jgi:hypothetical protein
MKNTLYWKRVEAGLCWKCGGALPEDSGKGKNRKVWKLKSCPTCAENERWRVLATQSANRAYYGKPFPSYPYPK